MDPSVTMLLVNDVVKVVFKEVLKNRRIQFKELRESLIKAPEIQASLSKEPELRAALSSTARGGTEPAAQREIGSVVQSRVEDAVQQLKDAKLIEERPASIKDFSTLYVTENGLNAGRELRIAAL